MLADKTLENCNFFVGITFLAEESGEILYLQPAGGSKVYGQW